MHRMEEIMKPLSTEQKLQYAYDGIAVAFLLGFCIWINRGIAIKGLSGDDLYLWAGFKEQSFFSFVFPLGGSRFRCLYYLAAWLEMALLGPRVEWLVPVNMVLNSLLAAFLYGLGGKLSGRKLFGFFGGVLFLMSRMAFYQIGQMTGLVETMACFLAIGFFYCLYVYLHEKQEKIWYFHGACLLYFALCFVHERFMLLVLLFYVVLLLKKRFQLRKWFWPLRQLLLVMAIRFLAMGRASVAGIGQFLKGDGVSLKEVFRHGMEQAAYLLGINLGPKHLNGLSWEEAPKLIHGLVLGADILLAVLLAAFLFKVIREKEEKGQIFAESLLFLAFLGLCMLSCSFSRQVEVPWIYVSYGGMLLLLLYLCGIVLPAKPCREENQNPENSWNSGWSQAGAAGDSAEANYLSRHAHQQIQKKGDEKWAVFAGFCGFVLYLVLMLPVEFFFRSNYSNLYFWKDLERYNSLAEETYGKYGEEIFGKTIYVIGSNKEIPEEVEKYFFQVFAENEEEQKTELVWIDSIRDIGLVTNQMLVLREDKENAVFQDITQFVKELKFNPEFGLYADGWMDEECRFTILSGAAGKIRFQFLYPGQLYGEETTEIYIDGELWQSIAVTANIYSAEIQAEPYQTLEVEIKSNFYVEDALEQRGEKHLTALLEIEAE